MIWAGNYWHQGYMSEALRAMLAYGFETLELNRIEALVMPENEASAILLLRLGFSEEGVLREYAFFKGAVSRPTLFLAAAARGRPNPWGLKTLRVLDPKGLKTHRRQPLGRTLPQPRRLGQGG